MSKDKYHIFRDVISSLIDQEAFECKACQLLNNFENMLHDYILYNYIIMSLSIILKYANFDLQSSSHI